jgi:hypothetical protein
MSIQSLILGEYNATAAGELMTVDGRKVSKEDYSDYRLATLRYACTGVLRQLRGAPTAGDSLSSSNECMYSEFEPIIRAFFLANRHRMLQILKRDLWSLRDQQPAKAMKLEREIVRLVEEFRLLDR